MDVSIALVHYPIKNRRGEVVSTAVTNLDIHDLARTAATYACEGYVMVSPLLQQREMVRRIADHWRSEAGRARNPIRARAFDLLWLSPSLEDAVATLTERHGTQPWVVATGAAFGHPGGGASPSAPPIVDWRAARTRLQDDAGSALIVFGTGWGLTDDVVARQCHARLPGIEAVPGRRGYNHLPVRAAVAIALDRLLGDYA